MPTSTPAPTGGQTPAQLAKSALRRLAEQKLEPTPENYRLAYNAEAGVAGSQPPTPAHAAAPVTPQTLPEPPAAATDDGERWSQLISRILRGAERGGRQWTSARKKDSLQRVLEGSKSSSQRLHQRLSQLVSSWDSDTNDSSLLDADTPAPQSTAPDTLVASGPATSPAPALPQPDTSPPTEPLPAWSPLALHAVSQLHQALGSALPTTDAQAIEARNALHAALDQAGALPQPAATLAPAPASPSPGQARSALSEACNQARRVIEHRHHLIAQLTGLCDALTDSLSDLCEDDSWVQGQAQAMRHHLQEGLHGRSVRHVQQLLSDTRERQRTLKHEREAARAALKQLIHQMLHEIGELGTTTDRFQDSLGHYADTIGQADSIESLAGVVREMIEGSRAVQSVVSQAQTRLQSEHQRATELSDRVRSLEDEIRKLSNEVSTDPLTQIANRRGLMRAFEAEQARVSRNDTPLAIGLLDVDNFKRLNDQLGHQTGDEALKFLARRVGECLRPVDVVARYGGEEFVVLLPDTPADEGQQALTRLQRTLSAEFFTHDDKKVFITFSAGVTQYRLGEAIEAALDRADLALYEAKRTGKNRTCLG